MRRQVPWSRLARGRLLPVETDCVGHVDVNRGPTDAAKATDQSTAAGDAEQAALVDLFDRWSAWPEAPKGTGIAMRLRRIKAVIASIVARLGARRFV